MRKLLSILLMLILLAQPLQQASAQSYTSIELVPGTVTLATSQREAVLAWLENNKPADTTLYSATYFQPGSPAYVSLVGLRPDLPAPYAWELVDTADVIWMGTLLIQADGSITPYGLALGDVPLKVHAAPDNGAGGSSQIAFPWQAGSSMIYGPRGIHGEGDYSTTGMYAVDWVGGDNITNSAPAAAYASAAGTIDWVCSDGISVAVRITDGTDTFVYAHLLDNANLVNGSAFSRGALIGSLKYGSFNDNCGWAQQDVNHYHIHWMFTPRNSHFQAESWILNFGDSQWHNGSAAVGTGDSIIGGGGSGAPGDPPPDDGGNGSGTTVGTGTFVWDFLINGFSNAVTGVMGSFLYRRTAVGGADGLKPISINMDENPGDGGLPTPTPTPMPVSGSSGLSVTPRPAYSDLYWAQMLTQARGAIHESTLVAYIFSIAFPSMNLIIFVFTILIIAGNEFIVWAMKIMKLIGEFWDMFPGL